MARYAHLNDYIVNDEELKEFFGSYFSSNGFVVDDIRNPKPDRVFQIYKAFIADFGICEENLHQPLLTDGSINLTENFDEIVQVMHVYCILKQIFASIVDFDFNIRDLLEPRRKRTRVFISLLKGRWEYVNCSYNKYLAIKEDLEKSVENVRSLCNRREILRRKINNLRAKSAENQVHAEKLETQCIERRDKLDMLLKQKSEYVQRIDNHKTKFTELKSQKDKLALISAEKREQEEEINKNILQSPERVKSDMKALREEVIKKQEYKAHKQRCLIDVNKLIDKFDSMKIESERAFSLVNNRTSQLHEIKELEFKDSQKYKGDKENNIQQQQNQINRSRKMLGIKMESLNKLMVKNPHKLSSMKENNQQLQQDLIHLREQQDQHSIVKYQMVDTLKELKEKSVSNQQSIANMKQEVQKIYTDVLNKVDGRHSEILYTLNRNSSEMLTAFKN